MLISVVILMCLAALLACRACQTDHCSHVPYPWTDVQADRTEKGVWVDVWGRRYSFAGGLLPEQITTASEDILAEPIRLKAEADAEPIAWEKAQHFIASNTKDRAVLCSSQNSSDVIANAVYTIEYDGTMKVDLSIFPHLGGAP